MRVPGLSDAVIAMGVGLVAPFVCCLALVPARDDLLNTHLALVLVLVVTTVAAFGTRLAGLVTAAGSGIWFDFFFTEPYQTFVINSRDDLETALLLLLVGVGVTELAVWGRRQQARASRDEGYLAGIQSASRAGATGGSSGDLITQVSNELTTMLGLRACRFEYGVAGLGSPARLRRDGEIEWKREPWDVDQRGLPVDVEIEVLVESHGLLRGRFMLTARPNSRVPRSVRMVAVTLADQVGAALV